VQTHLISVQWEYEGVEAVRSLTAASNAAQSEVWARSARRRRNRGVVSRPATPVTEPGVPTIPIALVCDPGTRQPRAMLADAKVPDACRREPYWSDQA
jgi:hypothetical protein